MTTMMTTVWPTMVMQLSINCKLHSNYRDVHMFKKIHFRIDEIIFLLGSLTVFKETF